MSQKHTQFVKALFYLNLVSMSAFLSGTMWMPESMAESNGSVIETGTIEETMITTTIDGSPFMVITLDNGKKYRLKPDHGLGFSKGCDVELIIETGHKSGSRNEETWLPPNLIEVAATRITAIPLPGTDKKVRYPIGSPPEVLDHEEGVLTQIERKEDEERVPCQH